MRARLKNGLSLVRLKGSYWIYWGRHRLWGPGSGWEADRELDFLMKRKNPPNKKGSLYQFAIGDPWIWQKIVVPVAAALVGKLHSKGTFNRRDWLKKMVKAVRVLAAHYERATGKKVTTREIISTASKIAAQAWSSYMKRK